LNQLAKESKFVQRKGKLNGSLFLDLIVFHSENLKSQSLNDLSIALKDKHEIEITKQSLHNRFNKYALVFLKNALETVLQKQLCLKPTQFKELRGFNRILIKDSTCFQIDESLAKYYPGSGGAGSAAAVRIQFEYDILTGKITDLSVNAFNDQDASNSMATIELTKHGDLIIRDLAYMGLEVLQSLGNNDVFYLCRSNPNVYIFEKTKNEYTKIDFIELTNYLKKHNINCLEKEVYLGSREKLKTRLIIHLLPEHVVAERLRKANKYNKKQGGKGLSKEYKAKAALNLFITNTSQDQIPTEYAWQFYKLRWQIELMFKIWKSICSIEKVKKVKKARLECYIYSKLILIVLAWQILWRTAFQLVNYEKKSLSFFKAAKTLLSSKLKDLRNIALGKCNTKVFMRRFYELSRTNHLLEKRLKKLTSAELLFSCLHLEVVEY
jgi:hypothetical protein